jgi:hypothetical protein
LPVKVSRGRSGIFLAFLVRDAGFGFFGFVIGLALGLGLDSGAAVAGAEDEVVGEATGLGLDGAEKAEAEAMTVRPRAAVPATAPIAKREGVRARRKSMGEAMPHVYQSP